MEANSSTPDKAVSMYLKPRNRNSPATGNAPDKIRCYIGGEWKPRSEFSARQLEKFARHGSRPGNSNISCRAHSAQNRRELCCEGPCGSWLPLESFSKNTRARGKVWCLNCTEWQLSVEPGFTPYVPPAPVDGINEFPLLEDADGFSGNQREEHIENWIDGNPSEVDGYERLEISTQNSVNDASSEASALVGPSLLDNDDSQILGGLPQALNAVNLGRNEAANRYRPSDDSVASDNTAGLATRPRPAQPPQARTLAAPASQNPSTALTIPSNRGKNTDWLLLDEVNETTNSDTSSDRTFTFANTSKAPSVAPSASHTNTTTTAATAVNTALTTTNTVTHTSWMEAEFVPLRLPQSNPPPASIKSDPWARPTQRKTDFYTPKYVVEGSVQDPHSQNFQKTVYADMDDDDSEDEC